jgi:hypothetical protein
LVIIWPEWFTGSLFKTQKQMTAAKRLAQMEVKIDKIMKALAIDDEKEVISRKELAKNIRNSLLNQNSNVRTRKVR